MGLRSTRVIVVCLCNVWYQLGWLIWDRSFICKLPWLVETSCGGWRPRVVGGDLAGWVETSWGGWRPRGVGGDLVWWVETSCGGWSGDLVWWVVVLEVQLRDGGEVRRVAHVVPLTFLHTPNTLYYIILNIGMHVVRITRRSTITNRTHMCRKLTVRVLW